MAAVYSSTAAPALSADAAARFSRTNVLAATGAASATAVCAACCAVAAAAAAASTSSALSADEATA